jgi:hypothetical protein
VPVCLASQLVPQERSSSFLTLVRSGSACLRWYPPSSRWNRERAEKDHVAGQLCLAVEESSVLVILQKGGRLSKGGLLRYLQEIDGFFKPGTTKAINIKKTLVV